MKNVKRRRTAIFFVGVAQKGLIEHTSIDFKKKNFREKKVVEGDFDGRIQANVGNKTRDSSL